MTSQTVDNPASSPLKGNTGRSAFSSTTDKRAGRIFQVEVETRGKWRGPVSPIAFLDEYLPPVSGTIVRPAFESQDYRVPGLGTQGFTEDKMYAHLAPVFQRFTPDLDAVITANVSDDVAWEHQKHLIKPDLSLYCKGISRPRTTVLPDILAFFEFKPKASSSGFRDNGVPGVFEKDTNLARETRGQLATYAGAMMAVQFRTHVIAVEVTGENARLLRFDREGCIVTESFSYVTETHLVEFLWRFNHASSEDRGYDKSVTTPPASEDSHVSRARTVLRMEPTAKVWRFEVFDEATQKIVVFYGGVFVGELVANPFGRCTRGFYVITIDGKRIYLKDTWRIDLLRIDKEGVVYEKLHAADVPHIPHLVAHGDVKGRWQKTAGLERFSGRTEEHRRPYQHYFIGFREIGRDLESFRTIWELVNAVKCAIKAHNEAFKKAKVLHRDISVGNVLISEDGTEGLLIDWDFSKPVTTDIETPRQPERTGTWQFISAHLLNERHGLHTRADDLESFFHVLAYVILRLGKTSIGDKKILEQLNSVYDYAVLYRGETSGGEHKRSRLVASWMAVDAGISNECLRDLVADFEELVAVRYIKGPSAEDRKQYERLLLMPGLVHEDPLITRDLVWKYDKKKERLEDWSWIYERFCKATEDPSQLSDVPDFKRLENLEKDKLVIFGRFVASTSSKRSATDDISSQHQSQRSKTD